MSLVVSFMDSSSFWYSTSVYILCLQLHCQCHHQNASSHFNVSLIVRDKVTRQCPQATTFDKSEEKGELKQI